MLYASCWCDVVCLCMVCFCLMCLRVLLVSNGATLSGLFLWVVVFVCGVFVCLSVRLRVLPVMYRVKCCVVCVCVCVRVCV